MTPDAATPNVAGLYGEIGGRIRKVRERSGLTQGDVAAKTGLSRASITQFESGHQKLPLESIYLVAAVLCVAIAEVLPKVEDLTSRSSDVFARLNSDTELGKPERAALTSFFKQVVPDGGR